MARIFLIIFGLIFFFGCADKTELKPIPIEELHAGIEADTRELLKTLARIARIGSSAICSPVYLQKELNLRFVNAQIYKDKFPGSTIAEVYSASKNIKLLSGVHRIYLQSHKRNCLLSISFKQKKMCSLNILEVKRILGASEKYGMPVPGTDMEMIFYEFRPATGTESRIDVGSSGSGCNNGFSISSREDVK